MSMNCGQLLMHWSVQKILGDLNILESWADRSHIKSRGSKCRIVYMRCKQQATSNRQVATKQLCRNEQRAAHEEQAKSELGVT